MHNPLKAALVASAGVFLASLLAAVFHDATINGRALTPLEQLPSALIGATIFSALALLGTWLGLRSGRHVTYLAGIAVSVAYVAATFLANSLFHVSPQTVTIPSHQAAIHGLQVLLMGMVWGIGAPYLIALLVRRLKFGTSNGA